MPGFRGSHKKYEYDNHSSIHNNPAPPGRRGPRRAPCRCRSARPSRVRSIGCAPVSLRAVCQPRTVDVRTHDMRGAGGRGARSRGPRLGDLAWPITASGAVPVCRPGRARNTSNRHDPRLSFKPCRQLHNCWRLGSRGSTAGEPAHGGSSEHSAAVLACYRGEFRWGGAPLATGTTAVHCPSARLPYRRVDCVAADGARHGPGFWMPLAGGHFPYMHVARVFTCVELHARLA